MAHWKFQMALELNSISWEDVSDLMSQPLRSMRMSRGRLRANWSIRTWGLKFNPNPTQNGRSCLSLREESPKPPLPKLKRELPESQVDPPTSKSSTANQVKSTRFAIRPHGAQASAASKRPYHNSRSSAWSAAEPFLSIDSRILQFRTNMRYSRSSSMVDWRCWGYQRFLF